MIFLHFLHSFDLSLMLELHTLQGAGVVGVFGFAPCFVADGVVAVAAPLRGSAVLFAAVLPLLAGRIGDAAASGRRSPSIADEVVVDVLLVANASQNVEGGGSMRFNCPAGASVVVVVELASALLFVDVSAASLPACMLYV